MCEIAFGSNPGDSSYSWTDVSAYLRSFHISRGRQYELNAMQAGTCDIVLKNLDRRFEPGYASSPYYPNIRPMVPVRLRVANAVPKDAASPLTLSGNEILDSNRTAALSWTTSQSGGQTDGLTTPAGVFVGRAATNLFRRGQCDATTDYNASGTGVTIAIDNTVPASFSPQSIKVTCDGTAANQGVDCTSATGLAVTAGTNGVESIRFKGTNGNSYRIFGQWANTDATTTTTAVGTFTSNGSWQLLGNALGGVAGATLAALAVAVGKTGDSLHIIVQVNGTRAESFWVAHAMLEKGQSVVAPYVATSGGTTATKNAARVQAPSTLLTEAQGWIAARVRLGWGATIPSSGAPMVFEWRNGTAPVNQISLFRASSTTWEVDTRRNGTLTTLQSNDGTHAAGDVVTLIAYWTSTTIGLSVNGGAFVTTTRGGSVGGSTLPSTFEIGNRSDTTLAIDSDIDWFACGTGTLSSADASTIAAFPNTPAKTNSYYQQDASVLLWPSTSSVTAFWQAVDSGYRVPSDAILFTGYVERFPQNRTGPSYAETQIQAVDGFELLSNATLAGATYPSEVTGSRIGRVLDAVSWSSSARSIATGQSTIASYTFASTDMVVPLSHIQDVELSELGTFFITNDGRAKFQDRRSLGSTNSATFTDQPSVDTTAIGYADIVVSYDKDYIYNSWSGTRTGGTTQTVINSASITQYFLRSQSRTPLLTTDGDVQTQMQYLTATYAQPYLRVESITVTPGNNTNAWLQLLARDLTDRISVLEHPPGGGTTLVQDSYIQQIDLTVPTDPADTKLVYSLLPAGTNNFWQASVSKVGTDTRAGY